MTEEPPSPQVSKQKKLAHVIMASSDSGFLTWIETRESWERVLCRRVFPRELLCPARSKKTNLTYSCFLKFVAAELSPFYSAEVVGDFTEPEARSYFDKQLQQTAATKTRSSPGPPPAPLSDAEWARVHEVCGGNPGRLTTVAFSASGGLQPGDLDRGGRGCSALGGGCCPEFPP